MATNDDPSSWAEVLARLEKQLGLDVSRTCLVDWDASKDTAFKKLREERDRVLAIKSGLDWLSADADARVDRRLKAAGEVIDAKLEARQSEAALKLSQAVDVMERAWHSRRWNRYPSPIKLPAGPFRSPPAGSWARAGWVFVSFLKLLVFPLWLLTLPIWVVLSFVLLGAFGGTVWIVYDAGLYPTGDNVGLRDALFGAALWGLGGALVNAVRTVHHESQKQQFEIERFVWYLVTGPIGFAFGSIAFLLYITGLLGADVLETGKAASAHGAPPEGSKVNPAPILLFALLAGFAQNAFIGALQQIIRERFRGAPEEDATS